MFQCLNSTDFYYIDIFFSSTIFQKLAKPLACMNTSEDGESDKENVEGRLAQHFVYIHGVLQNIENRLTNELLERENYIGNNINAIKEQLKEQKEEIENAIRVSNGYTHF